MCESNLARDFEYFFDTLADEKCEVSVLNEDAEPLSLQVVDFSMVVGGYKQRRRNLGLEYLSRWGRQPHLRILMPDTSQDFMEWNRELVFRIETRKKLQLSQGTDKFFNEAWELSAREVHFLRMEGTLKYIKNDPKGLF